MEKKTLLAVVALLGLGVAAALTLTKPQKGQRTGAAPRPVQAFKAAEVTEVEISSDKQTKTTLKKVADVWKLDGPEARNADPSQTKNLVDGLEKLSFGDVVTENEAKHEEFGVAESKAARLVAKGAGKTLLDLHVGKTVGAFTMVRPAGSKAVWQASGVSAGVLNKDASSWRDHTILTFVATDADKLTIESAAGSRLVVERQAEGKKWKVAEQSGDGPKNTDALDAELAQSLVASLSTIKASDFVDGKPPAEVDFGKPVVTLTVNTKAGAGAITLLVGQTVGDDTFVQVKGQPQIYSLKKFAVERILRRPVDFLDKSVAKLKEADLVAIDVQSSKGAIKIDRDKDGWKLAGGDGDTNKLKGLAGSFEALVATGLLESGELDRAGLKSPTATVTLTTKDKAKTVLKIGAESADKSEYYVQRVGTPSVFRLKKYLVDRFVKKPTELVKEKKT